MFEDLKRVEGLLSLHPVSSKGSTHVVRQRDGDYVGRIWPVQTRYSTWWYTEDPSGHVAYSTIGPHEAIVGLVYRENCRRAGERLGRIERARADAWLAERGLTREQFENRRGSRR